ncbi:MAG: hypothetical protein JWM09_61 [Francisellaceae bacterium]|nr:hypothetical protein [Francisellaceae bacterium]
MKKFELRDIKKDDNSGLVKTKFNDSKLEFFNEPVAPISSTLKEFSALEEFKSSSPLAASPEGLTRRLLINPTLCNSPYPSSTPPNSPCSEIMISPSNSNSRSDSGYETESLDKPYNSLVFCFKNHPLPSPTPPNSPRDNNLCPMPDLRLLTKKTLLPVYPQNKP